MGESEKLLVTRNFSFCRSVFKRLVLQTRKNQGLFGKGLTLYFVFWALSIQQKYYVKNMDKWNTII